MVIMYFGKFMVGIGSWLCISGNMIGKWICNFGINIVKIFVWFGLGWLVDLCGCVY